MTNTLFAILLLGILGCGESLEEHNAQIVRIDPPVKEGTSYGPNEDDRFNLGVLEHTGWQPITVTFSKQPSGLRVEFIANHDEISEWTLQGPVLTIKVFCVAPPSPADPGVVRRIQLNWDSGYIVLNYYCPP